MKKINHIVLSLGLFLCTSLPVFAATGAREDNSMVLTYLFLGTCALIIMLQFIPIFAMVFGIVRGLFSKKTEEAKPETVKIQ